MPPVHRNVEAFAELLEPFKLVIDQSLERSHVQGLNGWLRILNQFGDNWQKGRLQCFLSRWLFELAMIKVQLGLTFHSLDDMACQRWMGETPATPWTKRLF